MSTTQPEKTIHIRYYILASASVLCLLIGGYFFLPNNQQQPLVSSSNATSTISIKVPTTDAEAQEQLAKLYAEEYAFKAETLTKIFAITPNIVPAIAEEIAHCLWLNSYNESVTAEIYKLLAETKDADSYESERILQSFIHNFMYGSLENILDDIVPKTYAMSDQNQAEQNGLWILAYQRKSIERELIQYLMPFSRKEQSSFGNNYYLPHDVQKIAAQLWPYREYKQEIATIATLLTTTNSIESIISKLQAILNDSSANIPKKLKNFTSEQQFIVDINYVEPEAISLAIQDYFPDLVQSIEHSSFEALAMTAQNASVYPPDQGTLPNGLIVKQVTSETIIEHIQKSSPRNFFVGLSRGSRDEPGVSIFIDTPLEPSTHGRFVLVPSTFLVQYLQDKSAQFFSPQIPLYRTTDEIEHLAAHLASLTIVYADRELRQLGNVNSLNEFLPSVSYGNSYQEHTIVTTTSQDTPGAKLRLANPLHSLYYFTLLEQASADQADTILGPVTHLYVYFPAEGWFSLSRGNEADADKWIRAATTSPRFSAKALHQPLSLPDAFLARLIQREQITLEKKAAEQLAYHLTLVQDKQNETYTPELYQQSLATIQKVTSVFQTTKTLSFTLREQVYQAVIEALTSTESQPSIDTIVNVLRTTLGNTNLHPQERLAHIQASLNVRRARY